MVQPVAALSAERRQRSAPASYRGYHPQDLHH
jgi:hypothetical protein